MIPLFTALIAISASPPNGPVGTWVRETDGATVALTLTPRRVTATLLFAFPDPDNPTGHVVRFDADGDLAAGPDGTLFGVVTGFDVTAPKGSDRDSVSELRRGTDPTGSPFAFRVRLDGDTLSVGDVRCGDLAGKDFAGRNPDAVVVLGRYRKADPRAPLPVPRPGPLGKPAPKDGLPPETARVGVDFNARERGEAVLAVFAANFPRSSVGKLLAGVTDVVVWGFDVRVDGSVAPVSRSEGRRR